MFVFIYQKKKTFYIYWHCLESADVIQKKEKKRQREMCNWIEFNWVSRTRTILHSSDSIPQAGMKRFWCANIFVLNPNNTNWGVKWSFNTKRQIEKAKPPNGWLMVYTIRIDHHCNEPSHIAKWKQSGFGFFAVFIVVVIVVGCFDCKYFYELCIN